MEDKACLYDICSEACQRTREWPCNGTCIDNNQSCNGTCKFDQYFRCKRPKSEWDCIGNFLVCELTRNSLVLGMVDRGSPKEEFWECEDGEDEADCPSDCPDPDRVKIIIDENGRKVCDPNTHQTKKTKTKVYCKGKLFSSTIHQLQEFLWVCDGQLQDISNPYDGECNFNESWKLCLGENGRIPNKELCPNESEKNAINSSSGKECRFRHR